MPINVPISLMAREYFTNYYSLIQLIPRVELRFDLAESSRQTYTPKGFIKIKNQERETIDIVKTHTTASKIEKKKKLAHSRSLIGNHTTTTTSPVACVWQMQSTFGIELFLPRCHTPNRRYIHIVVDKHITQSSVHTLSTIHLAPLSVFLSIASEIFIFISFLFSYCVLHSIRPITTDSPLSTPA